MKHSCFKRPWGFHQAPFMQRDDKDRVFALAERLGFVLDGQLVHHFLRMDQKRLTKGGSPKRVDQRRLTKES